MALPEIMMGKSKIFYLGTDINSMQPQKCTHVYFEKYLPISCFYLKISNLLRTTCFEMNLTSPTSTGGGQVDRANITK